MKRAVLLAFALLALALVAPPLIAAGRGILEQATFHYKATGGADRTAYAKMADVVSVKDFGALCDGTTDDAPAIRSAITAAGAGGTVYFPSCTNPYALNSYDSTVWQGNAIMFYVLDSQTIRGNGAQLKVAAGALNTGAATNGGSVFMMNVVTHATVDGIRLDMNGANNQTPSGGFHPAYAFIQEGGSYNKFLHNEVLNTPGRNAFILAGCSRGNCADQCLLRENVVRNGGTTLSGGNANQNDFSAYYVECTNAVVEANRTIHDNQPTSSIPNNGGIELHGSHTLAKLNILDKANPGFYIGSNTSGQDITDVAVEGNYVAGHLGVSFFPISLTDNYGRIKVTGNTFVLTQIPGYTGTRPAAISMQKNSNNIFTTGPGLLYDSELSWNSVTSTTSASDQSYGFALSQTKTVKVVGNTMSSLGRFGVWIEGAPLGQSDLLIEHNEIRDFNVAAGVNNMAILADAVTETPSTWTTLTGGVATAVSLHQWIRKNTNNGFTYEATTAGTTSNVQPTFPTVIGNTVTDGSVVWTCRAAWAWDGITIRNNVFSQTTNAAYRGIYTTNDTTASPSVPVTNLVVWPNAIRNVTIYTGGSPTSTAFSNLGVATPTFNGFTQYCDDCTIANPCAGGGTGAIAKRLNGAWVCN